ncbi:thiamine phosphate synthase, partial [Campylobacter sp. US18a]
IPLYAIGGINAQNIENFKDINIAGICMREILMKEKDLKTYIRVCKERLSYE